MWSPHFFRVALTVAVICWLKTCCVVFPQVVVTWRYIYRKLTDFCHHLWVSTLKVIFKCICKLELAFFMSLYNSSKFYTIVFLVSFPCKFLKIAQEKGVRISNGNSVIVCLFSPLLSCNSNFFSISSGFLSQKGSAMHLFFCFASWESPRAELLLQQSQCLSCSVEMVLENIPWRKQGKILPLSIFQGEGNETIENHMSG